MSVCETILTAFMLVTLASCAAAPEGESPTRTPHRVLVQVRAGAGGGNPNRIDMSGTASRYVDHISTTPLSFDTPVTSDDPSIAYSEGGPIPRGRKFIATKVHYHGTSAGDFNGHGEFKLMVGEAAIAHTDESPHPTEGTWTGRVEIEAGEEHSAFIEVANTSTGHAEILGYLVDSDRTKPYPALVSFDAKDSDLHVGELYSRRKYRDYERCTFSFEHGVRDDPDRSITRNDWELMFGNSEDMFSVTMNTEDRSKIVDLGELSWRELEKHPVVVPRPYPIPTRERALPVIEGHIYLVRTADRDSDLTALLRVEDLIPDDRVRFTWRLLED